ncbi:uncharacterized protein [Drosophila kikkawai]|uniref:Uncharacterized protein n=1 Tax=Drosophila kikkawai TaxID=30033 RepID=A0A6P4IRP1_DROKI|nr:uncharacterized protein LOC108076957 [Drosophila kikkawai]
MYNLIEYIKHKSVNSVGTSTVKLNANAQEFVPQLKKREAIYGADFDFKTMKPEIVPFDERMPKCKLTLPWKGFPRKPDKAPGSTQIVLLNDVDYMIVPRAKNVKRSKDDAPLAGKENPPVSKVEKLPKENVPVTSTTARLLDMEEKRREKERKVAVEALKLVEQRRMRGALLPTAQNFENPEAPAPIVHLSRSPIRYNPEERIKVDRLRAAKKERIERVLKEMHNEKVQLENFKKWQLNKVHLDAGVSTTENKSVVAATRRYIPTAKEWDEQCRAKHLAIPKLNAVKIRSTEVEKREDPKTTDIPRYRPPSQLLMGEKRKGNFAHSLPIKNWTYRRLPQTLPPLKNRMGKVVQRYSIEQLLLLEPQPEDLGKPDLDQGLGRLNIIRE